MKTMIVHVVLILMCAGAWAQPQGVLPAPHAEVATYSIVARDPETGDLGIAVQSQTMAVGAIVPYAKAGVGAVATQARADARLGSAGLDMLAQGLGAREVLDSLLKNDPESSARQIAIVGANGTAFGFTGTGCRPYAGQYTGSGFTVIGNSLQNEAVITAIARTFEVSTGDLAERLLAALDAGEKASTDGHARRSAALLVVRKDGGYQGTSDRYVDLRVDDDSLPLLQLRRLYGIWSQKYLGEARMRTMEAFRRDKNFSAAEQELQRLVGSMNALLRDKPDDPAVLDRVAWTLATNGIDPPRALELAKRAATLSPGNAGYLHTLAQCHFAAGHIEEAIAIESELVSKDPANDDYWRQLQRFKEARSAPGK